MYRSNQFYNYYPVSQYNNDTRFGFLGPFILGGITGGLAAPLFYNQPRPYYGYQPYYYPY